MFASPEENKKVDIAAIGKIDANTFKAMNGVASRIKRLSQGERQQNRPILPNRVELQEQTHGRNNDNVHGEYGPKSRIGHSRQQSSRLNDLRQPSNMEYGQELAA